MFTVTACSGRDSGFGAKTEAMSGLMSISASALLVIVPLLMTVMWPSKSFAQISPVFGSTASELR